MPGRCLPYRRCCWSRNSDRASQSAVSLRRRTYPALPSADCATGAASSAAAAHRASNRQIRTSRHRSLARHRYRTNPAAAPTPRPRTPSRYPAPAAPAAPDRARHPADRAVEKRHRNQPRGAGMVAVACPLQHRDGTERGRGAGLLLRVDMSGILSSEGRNATESPPENDGSGSCAQEPTTFHDIPSGHDTAATMVAVLKQR